MESDLFDDLLGLEGKFYDEGYQLGKTDGAKAGRMEGRVFGLEKGFEKFVESSKLHGRSLVWISRLPKNQMKATGSDGAVVESKNEQTAPVSNQGSSSPSSLPLLPENPRLEKHLRVLYALTEPVSLSTDNSEDAVSDFDDRFKRAQGKMKIIERLVAEEGIPALASQGTSGRPGSQTSTAIADAGTEDVNILKARH